MIVHDSVACQYFDGSILMDAILTYVLSPYLRVFLSNTEYQQKWFTEYSFLGLFVPSVDCSYHLYHGQLVLSLDDSYHSYLGMLVMCYISAKITGACINVYITPS